jgi:ArsR family transcriptional regulator, arsenate/arsenite/antimonite-responsive transcriptional repressor
MTNRYAENASVFKAFCDETRLRILELLRDGEKCTCVLTGALAVGQSALSYHMKILVDSGIVASRPDGKWTHYRISCEGCALAAERLRMLTEPAETPSEDANCRALAGPAR